MHTRRVACRLVLGLVMGCLAWVGQGRAGEVGEDFNVGWRFSPGDPAGASAAAYDDSGWRRVDVPHDWAVELGFDRSLEASTGKLPWRGVGWYRKTFVLAEASAGSRLAFDFDGVMADSTVYVNGQEVGGWDYGYNSFRVDATEAARWGAKNVIAVRASTERHQSRWYPGAGMYRSVRMAVLPAVHVGHWGVWVRGEEVSAERAVVRMDVRVENHLASEEEVRVGAEIRDRGGEVVGVWEATVMVGGEGEATATGRVALERPALWDVEDPALYTAVTTVRSAGAGETTAEDRLETTFGLRTAQWTADEGFVLNGRVVELRGVNLHHDQGPLGAALYPRALERQLEIMAQMGVNAIRTSHNVPDPHLLALCDRMGMVVVNEVFDKWYEDVYEPYREYAQRQIRNFVLRDRNHPCVVLWSAGNEVYQQSSETGGELAADLVGYFHALDPTRPVMIGSNNLGGSVKNGFVEAMDVVGWNYGDKYLQVRGQFPEKAQFASESASTVSTRGYYSRALPKNKTDFEVAVRQVTSYDLCAPSWADLPDWEFARQEDNPWVAGEFVWTGFDYLGEPTPFGKYLIQRGDLTEEEASRSSYFGIVDLCGLVKDRYWLYRSHWRPEEVTVHILPHWTWPGREGEVAPVFVYTNGDEAELFLNGRSLGRRAKAGPGGDALDRYRLGWREVAYEPGVLEAVAYRQGRRIGSAQVATAGEPAWLHVSADRNEIAGDGMDLAYVTVEARDAAGNVCPWAEARVSFSVEGPVEWAGAGNGDPQCMDSLVDDSQPLFHGKAVGIVRAQRGVAGEATVVVRAEGLQGSRVVIQVVAEE